MPPRWLAHTVSVYLQTVLIKPEELQANGITVHKVVQHPGDFIINFPGELCLTLLVLIVVKETNSLTVHKIVKHPEEFIINLPGEFCLDPACAQCCKT